MLIFHLSLAPLMLIQEIDNSYKIIANFSEPKSRKINFSGDPDSLLPIKKNTNECDFQVQVSVKSKIVGTGIRSSEKENVYRILGTGKFGVYSCIPMPDIFVYNPKKPLILNKSTYPIFEWVSENTNNFISTDKLCKTLITGWNFILSLEQLESNGIIKKMVTIITKEMLKEFRNSWIELYYDHSVPLHVKWPVYEKTKFPSKINIPAPITALLSSFEYDAIICDGIENNVSVILPHVNA
jgi:hypothetical protein